MLVEKEIIVSFFFLRAVLTAGKKGFKSRIYLITAV
jgi:hypothetical protein